MNTDVVVIFYMNGIIKNYVSHSEKSPIFDGFLEPHFTKDLDEAMQFPDDIIAKEQQQLFKMLPDAKVIFHREWVSVQKPAAVKFGPFKNVLFFM